MADPLSVAASVASLVSVGVRLSTGLYDVCETISSAQDDIEDIASDLTSFVVVVDELGKIFAAPGRIYSDKLESNLLDIIKKCRHVFRQINRMIEKTDGATKMKLQSKVAWVFRKTKVQELKASLNSLKLTMGLMLQTLKLVKDHQHDSREERQVLGNLLRSQTRSVKVLRDIENKQERKPRANRASRPKKPPGLDDGPLPTTAEVLSNAIPPLPGRENPSTNSPQNINYIDLRANLGKQAPQQDSNVDWRQTSIFPSSHFERSLGSLYPLWRERAPEHVEVLVSQWTQPSHEPARPIRDPATNQKDSRISGDAEYLLETTKIEDENVVLGKLESEAKASRAKAEERLQKIEDRLKKRENGWLEIDDKALARLIDETKSLHITLKSNTTALESYASSREQLTDRVKAATGNFYARRQAKEEEDKKWNQPSPDHAYCRQPLNNRLNDFETFIERRNLIGYDSDTDSDTDPEPDIEEATSQNENCYDEKEVVVVVPDAMKLPAKMPDEHDFIAYQKPLDAEANILSSKPSHANGPQSSHPLHFGSGSSTLPTASPTNTTTSFENFNPSISQSSLPPQLIPGYNSSTAPSAAHGFSADHHSSLPPHVRQGSSVSIPSSESSKASSSSGTIVGDSPQSTQSSKFSLGSTTSLASEVNNTAMSSEQFTDPHNSPESACNPPLTCNRKAWKPPQPFLDGYNTFSHVLGTAKHVCLWFKASQDAYTFYLGDQKTSFYTLHLVPEDLSTYNTSRVEWTVVEKPWATAKALRAMNLVYMEDAVGFLWIRKELNWHQIKQLFDFSCVLLDNAINESAREIMQRRSEDDKKISSLEKSFMSLRRDRDEKKVQSLSMYEQHRVFFFLDHNPQSNSKQPRFLRSSS